MKNNLIFRFYNRLTGSERYFFWLVVMSLILVAGLEAVSLSLLPLAFEAMTKGNGESTFGDYGNWVGNLLGWLDSPDEWLLAVLIVFLIKGALQISLKVFQNVAIFRYVASIEQELFLGLTDRSFLDIQATGNAEIIRNMTAEIYNFQIKFLQPLLLLTTEVILIIVFAAILIAISPPGILIVIAAFFSLLGAVFYSYRIFLHRLGERRHSLQKKFITVITEYLDGIETIRAYEQSHRYRSKFNSVSSKLASVFSISSTLNGSSMVITEISLLSVLTVSAIFVGSDLGESNLLTLGAFYLIALGRIYPSSNRILRALSNMKFGQPAAEALLVELGEERRHRGEAEIEPPSPNNCVSIDCRDIGFRYSSDSAFQFRNLNIRFPSRGLVAVVGENGIGKSTFVRILAGIIDPTEGRVVYASDANTTVRISTVTQAPFLEAGSVKENIAFGRHWIKSNDIHSVWRKYGFETGLLPSGLNLESDIGTNGIQVSGGQMQRIAIARSIVGDSGIILLDEPTSALDDEAVGTTVAMLEEVAKERLVIVVTHNKLLEAAGTHILRFTKGKVNLSENLRRFTEVAR